MIGKVKYLLFLLLLLYCANLQAQKTGLYYNAINEKSNRLPGKLQGEIYYLTVVSSVNYFLQPEWEKGDIKLKDGDVFKGIKMKYNAFDDELVAYSENNKSLFVVDKNTIQEFTFYPENKLSGRSQRKFVNLDSVSQNQNKTFFEQLYSGSASFLAFHKIEIKKTQLYTDVSGKLSDTVYEHKTQYYYYSDKIGMVRIRLKNKSFTQLFPENKKEIRKQLRRLKISVRNEQSAIQAFEVLDNSGLLK